MIKLKTTYKSVPERQPGARWTTKRYGEFEIIGKIDDGTGKYYYIKFINTGYCKIANGSAFASGNVKDPMARIVFGEGYIGEGEYHPTCKGKITKEGHLWYNMLERCYSPIYQEKNPTYKEVEVCERWKCFQNFCEDIKNIEGYEEWVKNNNWALDKDKKIKNNKLYCLEACIFIYEGENTSISNKSKSVYMGESPSGEIYYFKNQRKFAEIQNLCRRGISAVISGDQNTHRGWKFKRLSDEEIAKRNQEGRRE